MKLQGIIPADTPEGLSGAPINVVENVKTKLSSVTDATILQALKESALNPGASLHILFVCNYLLKVSV
jgi:hypothetical protein